MLERPGPGPYPPEHVWRFPPPPVSRWWLTAAITAGILGLTAFSGAFTFLAINSTRDIPGFIDDVRVLDVTVEECEQMREAIDDHPLDGTPADRLKALEKQNAAVTEMVERIRRVSESVRRADQPLDAWLADWDALVSGREYYATQQRRGRDVDFQVPRSPDGEPINERMDFAAEGVCTVPKVLLRPDAEGAQPI